MHTIASLSPAGCEARFLPDGSKCRYPSLARSMVCPAGHCSMCCAASESGCAHMGHSQGMLWAVPVARHTKGVA